MTIQACKGFDALRFRSSSCWRASAHQRLRFHLCSATRRGAPGALSAPQDDSHNDVGKGCRFVLYKVGSIIMTVAINALYLIFVHFYALAFLASCSTR